MDKYAVFVMILTCGSSSGGSGRGRGGSGGLSIDCIKIIVYMWFQIIVTTINSSHWRDYIDA